MLMISERVFSVCNVRDNMRYADVANPATNSRAKIYRLVSDIRCTKRLDPFYQFEGKLPDQGLI
jgi:hypothetical protein